MTKDNDGPTPTPNEMPAVWIWTDGQVGGPFPFADVEALVASGEAPPGLLAKLDGCEWLPWPEFSARHRPVERAEPVPDAPPTSAGGAVTTEELGMGLIVVLIILLGLLLVVGSQADEAKIASFGIGMIALPALFYFAPLYIAWKRKHPQILAIGVLNLVGGWTVIGWIVAMVWACTLDRSQARRSDAPAS